MTVGERAATYLGLGRPPDAAPARSRLVTALGSVGTGYLCLGALVMAVEADGTWPVGWRLAAAGLFGFTSAVSGLRAARWRPARRAGPGAP